jgi:hypothetical protein
VAYEGITALHAQFPITAMLQQLQLPAETP